MRRLTGSFCFLLALFATSTASAQYHVVTPNISATQAGNGGLNTFIRDINAPRSGQLLIADTQLAGIVPGHQISGITFRMFATANNPFPPTGGATWSDYSIWVGQGVAPSAGTTTFANNFIGTPTLVRSGPLTIPENSFPFGSTLNNWGYELVFDTPFVYTGGHLNIEIRHTGSDITNPPNSFLDALTTAAPGYGTDFRSFTATTYGATTGAQASFTIARLTVIPEPSSLGALAVGAALVVLRRRKRTA